MHRCTPTPGELSTSRCTFSATRGTPGRIRSPWTGALTRRPNREQNLLLGGVGRLARKKESNGEILTRSRVEERQAPSPEVVEREVTETQAACNQAGAPTIFFDRLMLADSGAGTGGG